MEIERVHILYFYALSLQFEMPSHAHSALLIVAFRSVRECADEHVPSSEACDVSCCFSSHWDLPVGLVQTWVGGRPFTRSSTDKFVAVWTTSGVPGARWDAVIAAKWSSPIPGQMLEPVFHYPAGLPSTVGAGIVYNLYQGCVSQNRRCLTMVFPHCGPHWMNDPAAPTYTLSCLPFKVNVFNCESIAFARGHSLEGKTQSCRSDRKERIYYWVTTTGNQRSKDKEKDKGKAFQLYWDQCGVIDIPDLFTSSVLQLWQGWPHLQGLQGA